jgi:peptide/nickel transport system substrate-binding protein
MYTNSKADALLSDIRTTASSTLVAQYYTALDKIMSDDMPALFLYTPDFIYAVPKTLGGVDLTTLMYPADRWSSVTDWYTETETVWNIFNK